MAALKLIILLLVCILLFEYTACKPTHSSNWAVLVCTSRYWFNYRHMSNTLSLYRTVKRLGIPDSNIILMLADDMACNPRNTFPGQMFNSESHGLNLYGTDVEVDYRGYEVTVENFIRVLTGRHDPAVPRSKRLLSDSNSNVLVYITGHGGNEFMKFQDQEELMAADVADALAQMWGAGRYREMLLVVETCQAATLYSRIASPNVLAMSASLKGESSYSYGQDSAVGLSLIDRFTRITLEFFESIDISSPATLTELFSAYTFQELTSHFSYRDDLFPRPPSGVKVTEFFGSVNLVRHTLQEYSYTGVGGGGDTGGGAKEVAGHLRAESQQCPAFDAAVSSGSGAGSADADELISSSMWKMEESASLDVQTWCGLLLLLGLAAAAVHVTRMSPARVQTSVTPS